MLLTSELHGQTCLGGCAHWNENFVSLGGCWDGRGLIHAQRPHLWTAPLPSRL